MRAEEGSKLSEEEAGRRVSDRRPADAEDSGREASGRERFRAEDAGEAIRRSGDPAIRRSGDPAIRHYTKGNPLNPCQPIHEIIFHAHGGGRNRSTQRADRMSSFVEDGHRDLSEPAARLAHAAHTSAKHHLFRLAHRMPNRAGKQSRVRKSARTRTHPTPAMPLPVSAATEPPASAPIPRMTMQAAAPSPASTALRA